MSLHDIMVLSYIVIVLGYFAYILLLWLQKELTEITWGVLIIMTILFLIPFVNHAIAICYLFDMFVDSFDKPVQKRRQ